MSDDTFHSEAGRSRGPAVSALTRRQHEIVEFIRAHTAERGFAPSLVEIGRHLGLKSPSTVHKHVQRLIARGALTMSPHRARSCEPALRAAPEASVVQLLGVVSAGVPIEASEHAEEVTVPNSLLRRPERSFALRVRGDSMVEDGIFDGDVVIVEAGVEARDGDTVVALVRGSEVTLKRLRRRAGMVELLPANARLRPLVLAPDDVAVQGVVRGLLRRCGSAVAS